VLVEVFNYDWAHLGWFPAVAEDTMLHPLAKRLDYGFRRHKVQIGYPQREDILIEEAPLGTV
jgi:hypothetical protein